MPRRSTKKNPEVELKPLGSVENHKGLVVSLNMKKASFFGVGDPGKDVKLWLTPEAWSATIPNNLSDEEARQITHGLNVGAIVAEKKWIPPVDKVQGTKEKYAALLKSNRLDEKAKEPFIDLVKKKEEGGYTPLEILTHCM